MHMTKIPNFGFSALLKVLNIAEAPQKAEIRKRYKPSGKGYDYHKNLRKRIQWLATGTHSFVEVSATLDEIKRKPERNSTERALKKFANWRKANPQPLLPSRVVKIASPRNIYELTFAADFVVEMGSRLTAIHVWNTQVDLSRNITLALLTQIAAGWPVDASRPQDFAVLSLQTGEIYKWSDSSKEHRDLGLAMIRQIEQLCQIAAEDLDGTTVADRPAPYPT
jgi:hypothetical protein